MKKPAYIIELENKGNKAIAQLRETEFEQGLPFMLGNLGLPIQQFYNEYPDGKIAVATYLPNSTTHQILYYLSEHEADELRIKHNLLPCLSYS